MLVTIRDFWYAAVLSVTLVAVILLALAVYQFIIEPRRTRQKVSRRLREGFQEKLWRIQILKAGPEGQTGWWPKLLGKILGERHLARLKILMLQGDVHQTPSTFLTRTLGLVILGALVGTWLLKSTLLGLLVAGALGVMPFTYLRWKKRVKTKKFETQMPDAMELLARSLRAGHTLPSALSLLGEEMEDPMGTEMGIAYEEQQFGISSAEALLHMLERVSSMDLRYFVAAVLIQQETGGNLAELMENIAAVIRSRLNFKAKVRGLTAMGRISTTIMIIVPIMAFLGLMVVAGHYEKVLMETAVGRTMLLAGIFLVMMGGFILKRMIRAVET